MIENPSQPMWCATLEDPAVAPAENDQQQRDAVREYIRTRSYDALRALKLVEGERLTLWRLRPLTPAQRAELLAVPDKHLRLLGAFKMSCDARYEGGTVGASGPEGGRLVERGKSDPDAWVVDQGAIGGCLAVDELGGIALVRASVHPKARELFKGL